MSEERSFQSLFAAIELGIMWCLWMVFGFMAGYMPGAKGGYSIVRCVRLRKILGSIPYESILSIAQGKRALCEMDTSNSCDEACETVSKEDIVFYAFMMNRKVRHGLRSFIGCLLLTAVIVSGVDWFILHLAIAGLFLFGITNFVQGVMEVTP